MSRAAWILPFAAGAVLTVQAAAPIKRVVSLAPNLTAIVTELGCGKSLVAVTPFCTAPEQITRVPGGMQPEAEAVLALEPDLVLASDITPAPTVRQLRDLGIRTEVIKTTSLHDIRDAVGRLADILGVPAGKTGDATVRPLQKKAVLLFGADTGYSAGRGTHAHEILEAAGLRNIAADTPGPWPQLSEEFLLAADPEIVVVADYGHADRQSVLSALRAHPLRKHLAAVRSGSVVVLPAGAFSVPGPEALEAGGKLRKELEKL